MFLTRGLLCVLCLLASAMAGTTTTPPAKTQPPNVILITLDTTRADRMGFLGSKRGLTPNLDALARQSVVFTHAYCQVPLTTASDELDNTDPENLDDLKKQAEALVIEQQAAIASLCAQLT